MRNLNVEKSVVFEEEHVTSRLYFFSFFFLFRIHENYLSRLNIPQSGNNVTIFICFLSKYRSET